MRTTVTKTFRALAVLMLLTFNHPLSTLVASSTEYITFSVPFPTYYYMSGLTLGPDGNFYGIADPGVPEFASNTVVYAVTTNALFAKIHAFSIPVSNGQGILTNSDGASPIRLFAGSDGYLYGITSGGGNYGDGTLFRMANGTFTTVISFANPNKEQIENVALGADGYFYGTFTSIGSFGDGSIIRMARNGAYDLVASFGGTNGSGPQCLTLGRDGSFYGTTSGGGINGDGTMFRVTTNDVLTTIISYGGTNGDAPGNLTLGADGNFYGTGAGTNETGSICRISTNGILTTLYTFSPLGFDLFNEADTNFDGAEPNSLILGPDGNLYGTTVDGGFGGSGTIFQVTRDGTVTALADIPALDFGAAVTIQVGGLTLGPDGNFYGVTSDFNLFDIQAGDIYQFSLPSPEPNIYGIYGTPSAGSMTVLLASLPGTTNILYDTTNLALPFAQWHSIATNTAPTTGFFQHTDSTTKGVPAKFYRLKLTR